MTSLTQPDRPDRPAPTAGLRHLVLADSAYGPNFWQAFCAHGRRVLGLEYLVLCLRSDQARFYADRDVFRRTLEVGSLLDAYGTRQFAQSDLVDFATDFERRTGTLISDVLQADRHLGRGYSYSGHRHPLSPLATRATYWDSVGLIKQLYETYLDWFDRHAIGVVLLGGVASLPVKLLCIAARTAGADVRVIASARIGNRFIWARDEFFSIPQVMAAWSSGDDAPGPAGSDTGTLRPETLGVYAEAANYQSWFSRRFTLSGLLNESLRDIAVDSRQLARRLLKGDAAKAGRYYLRHRLRNHLDVYRDYRTFRRCCDPAWKQPAKIPYVFLPLHVEPEASLTVFSPEFNCQVGEIDLVAKALPAGVTLVVKEHRAAIGRRPLGFYDWLQSIPAVVLAPLEASGSELARGSRVTVTITGTAGFEAAVTGVPVVTFGEHNFYNGLPHVHVMRDLGRLRGLLRELIEADELRADYRTAGERFFHCLHAHSTDLGEETLSPKRPPSAEAVAKLFDEFLTSLQRQG